MPLQLRHLLTIVAVAGLMFFANLGGPRLWDRDEPRNAGCAAEMIEADDWVTPRFNGELRTHKPVLLYWFIMSAYAVFGINEFAARFWSAVLGIGTSLLIYVIGRRLFNAQVGLWSAVVLSTVVMFDVAARAATPDSVLIFFVTAALAVYVVGTFRPRNQAETDEVTAPQPWVPGRWFPSWPVAACMYALMGIAMLAKGPVGLVIPTAVIGMFLLIMRLPVRDETPAASIWQRMLRGLQVFAPVHFLKTCWLMRPLTSLAVSLAVAAPWYIWAGIRTDGEFLRGFFLEHHVGRTLHAMEGHNGGIWYYPVAMLFGFFPWSVFAAPILIELTRGIRNRNPWTVGSIFAACWVGVYVGVFSIAQTKLPSYITPCYPGLALLTGCFVVHWRRGTAQSAGYWLYVGCGVLATIGITIAVAVPLAARHLLPGEELLGLLGAIPVIAAVATIQYARRGRHKPASMAFAMGAAALLVAIFGWAAVRVDGHREMGRLLAIVPDAPDDVTLGSLGVLEPSWVYYAKRSIHEVHLQPSEDPRATAARRAWYRRAQGVSDFYTGEGTRYLLTTDRHLERMDSMPAGVKVIASIPRFLRQDRLVLLGPEDEPRAARTAAHDDDDDGPLR